MSNITYCDECGMATSLHTRGDQSFCDEVYALRADSARLDWLLTNLPFTRNAPGSERTTRAFLGGDLAEMREGIDYQIKKDAVTLPEER